MACKTDDGSGEVSEEQSEAVRLLWGPHPKPSRGPKPALSLDRIARAGVEIADAEGLAAVSMQRVAGLLDVTKMALYRYMPGKAELVAVMVETAIGEAPPPNGLRHGWREQLGDWARHLGTVFHRHPWLLDATVGPRVIGPRELAWMEQALATLDGTGLTGAERMDAVVLLAGHVRGIVLQARAAGPAGSPEAQLTATLGELMRAHGERYPALTAALASAAQSGGQDQALEFGLHRILDGLSLLIAQRSN
ncbi:TetR/AcrR family transcriptional regulator [Streptomyces sp. AK02-04a]|uniref:TetR/AcrR family transcriptional regulator n=1 Tax=Streptomyces sp. AK02-04a TaxID=3028649 RepID=UPI0029A39059|nr:TetR/AcrR family transcriptional regulator C-terminal domain-containing protein [Streptomyces sp. AK02-04a]MDX3762929.1 TetR/AcrR family transcriptional regulator C-terminal domain-containing protein [Streptomyces sp. AK02-04a]